MASSRRASSAAFAAANEAASAASGSVPSCSHTAEYSGPISRFLMSASSCSLAFAAAAGLPCAAVYRICAIEMYSSGGPLSFAAVLGAAEALMAPKQKECHSQSRSAGRSTFGFTRTRVNEEADYVLPRQLKNVNV
jgi:hypothetical protein